jgi:spheroidene monooxygenase
MSPSDLTPAHPAQPRSDQAAVLLLADVAAAHRGWGWWRIARGARPWRRHTGLRFAKALGSGLDGGFGLQPSTSRQGVFLLFDHLGQAQDFLAHAPELQHYRSRSQEFFATVLQAWSSRGAWSGQALQVAAPQPEHSAYTGPIAALTRASIRPHKAAAFWRHAPAAQADLSQAQGCQLAVGLGEAPLLRQATFSLWASVEDMNAYARCGAHLAAIQAAQRHDFFSESMFVRFIPTQTQGRWLGRDYG